MSPIYYLYQGNRFEVRASYRFTWIHTYA